MLKILSIRNYALIEECDVEFEDGFNVLSGETGSGKSILIGAVNFALGGKVTRDIIRKGADNVFVELVFEVKKELFDFLSEEYGIYQDDTVVLSRRMTEKKNICKICGETVPLSKLREISMHLLDMHGQHDHQSLLDDSLHLSILDSCAKSSLGEIKSDVSSQFQKWQKAKSELEKYTLDETERQREQSYLEYAVNEIDNACIKSGEEDKLADRLKVLSNRQKIIECISNAAKETGYEMRESAGEAVGRALNYIKKAEEYDDGLNDISTMLSDVESALYDINRTLSDYIAHFDCDSESLYEVENRLSLIRELEKKYGQKEEDILEYAEKSKERLSFLKEYDLKKESAKLAEDKAYNLLSDLCEKLSQKRKEEAKTLDASITKTLKDLNFSDASFMTRIEKQTHFESTGCDKVTFLIKANKGSDYKPLSKTASGGELSRIMLSIKNVLAEADNIPTLIFDEIDSGISGKTAQKVSEKMSELGMSHQVICISHLPQIVAMADAHFLIEKDDLLNTAKTTVSRLDKKEQIEEIARLISGNTITDNTIKNAAEMKNQADDIKKSLKN